ncbi:MAG: hypothetical protein KGP14_12625, partial [Betaproteobacteria bacterium]|nr:hypothetical protein [Betaproteobacteria bacterium]
GLYAQAVPFAAILERLLACRIPEPLIFEVDRLVLMSYDPAEIGGKLRYLADFRLDSGTLCWYDEMLGNELAFLKHGLDM